MNVLEILNLSSKKLKYKDIPTYKLDSEILISKILNKTREEVLINLNTELNYNQIRKFNDLVERRSFKEPVAYILREKEFWSKKFEVSYETLIPRPETELMVEKLIKIYKDKSISILDIGSGSGCILISLLSELNNAKGLGIDVSKKAVLLPYKNLKKHKMTNRAKFLNRSVDDLRNNKFDLVVSNPPYIKRAELKNLDEDIKSFEPLLALDGGNDGLDVIKKVIYKANEILKVNGLLALEIGNGQLINVSKILVTNNFRIKYTIKDYKENTRCIISSLLK
ncbi:MAG: peptide chain release factor N(5)-glutamine methyltransferase [Pseudomonadota bacterium]|nr:peptide chain release factor N(5)-glutamine methyltransferase [Pseudomonadota bacterium]